MTDLDGWNDGPTTAAIDFVDRVTGGARITSRRDRVAVFDNDGTLWCEKPAYIQLDFIVRRLAQLAADDTALLQQAPVRRGRRRGPGLVRRRGDGALPRRRLETGRAGAEPPSPRFRG